MDGNHPKTIVIKDEPMDEMNADVIGQDVTDAQLMAMKQELEELTIKQEPDESVNEIPSKNQRKRHASSSVSAISANETMDDVMICEEIISVSKSKKNKPNDEETKGSIEPSLGSAASENSTSSIDQQGPDIAKIIEHEKVAKALSKLLGFYQVGGQQIRYAFTKYAHRVLRGSVYYDMTDTGDGYSVTVSTRYTGGSKTVWGIGDGHSMEDAKTNAVKNALLKFFPNILFDASKSEICILRVDNSMNRHRSGIGSESGGPSGNPGKQTINVKVEESACLSSKYQQERHASSSAANETMDNGQEDVMIFKDIIGVPKSKKIKPKEEEIKEESIELPSSEIATSENPSSPIDQQNPDIAKIIEHEKALKSLKQLLGFKKPVGGQGIKHIFSRYALRVLQGNIVYDTTDTGNGYSVTVNTRRRRSVKNTVRGIGNGQSVEEAKNNAVKDALLKLFPNILFDAFDRILRIDESMKEMVEKHQANPRKAKTKRFGRRRPKLTGRGPTC